MRARNSYCCNFLSCSPCTRACGLAEAKVKIVLPSKREKAPLVFLSQNAYCQIAPTHTCRKQECAGALPNRYTFSAFSLFEGDRKFLARPRLSEGHHVRTGHWRGSGFFFSPPCNKGLNNSPAKARAMLGGSLCSPGAHGTSLAKRRRLTNCNGTVRATLRLTRFTLGCLFLAFSFSFFLRIRYNRNMNNNSLRLFHLFFLIFLLSIRPPYATITVAYKNVKIKTRF